MLCACISVSNKRIAGYIPALSLSWCMISMPELHVRKKVQHYPVVYCIVCATSQCISGKFTLLSLPSCISIYDANYLTKKRASNPIMMLLLCTLLLYCVLKTKHIKITGSWSTCMYNNLKLIINCINYILKYLRYEIIIFPVRTLQTNKYWDLFLMSVHNCIY